MPIPVRLPPDTEYIRIGDIPNLLAEARYPELPPDTPRHVTEIKKYPIDDDLRREWCGNIIPFGVTLTDADWALLNSIWEDLPPLCLPISENEWQPYQDAFDAANIEGWRLEAPPESDDLVHLVKRRIAAGNLLKCLQNAAETREVKPLCRVSYTPIDCSSGDRFLNSLLTTRDLAAFASANGYAVETASSGGRERYTLEDAALPGPAVVKHSVATRSDPLNAVIRKAKQSALDADDTESVWAELVKMAEDAPKPPPLVGYSSDGVQYKGNSYNNTGVADVFTKKNLSDRMRRERRARAR